MDDLSPAADEVLLRDLECPVCMEYMVPPIKLCTNGHKICSKCRESAQRWPACRSKFSEIRNVALENIARRLKYPCANRQKGCLDMFSIEDISEHHTACVYGNIKCPFHFYETCSWNSPKNDQKENGKAAHPGYFKEESSFHCHYLSEDLTVLSCFGELFIFYLQKRDGRYYGAVQLIATSSEASKYKCEFSLRAANGIEQISKTFLVHGYSEDFETIFNSRKRLNLVEATIYLFVGEHKIKLSGTLSTL